MSWLSFSEKPGAAGLHADAVVQFPELPKARGGPFEYFCLLDTGSPRVVLPGRVPADALAGKPVPIQLRRPPFCYGYLSDPIELCPIGTDAISKPEECEKEYLLFACALSLAGAPEIDVECMFLDIDHVIIGRPVLFLQGTLCVDLWSRQLSLGGCWWHRLQTKAKNNMRRMLP